MPQTMLTQKILRCHSQHVNRGADMSSFSLQSLKWKPCGCNIVYMPPTSHSLSLMCGALLRSALTSLNGNVGCVNMNPYVLFKLSLILSILGWVRFG